MELPAELAEAVESIVAARQAWSPYVSLAVRCTPEVIAEGVRLGLFELWDRPDYLAVTLTPYGAWLRKVVIAERREVVEGGLREDVPYWEDAAREVRPVRLPREHRTEPLLFPEKVVDKRGPVYLVDEEEKPVELWGRKVVVDERMGRKAGAKRKAGMR